MKRVNLKGEIVSDALGNFYKQWGYTCTCPKDFESLKDSDEDLEIIINSRGGSVLDASEIYTALKDYKGKITAKIVGFAGSCASWIAMAADIVKISPMGFIMIHNSSSYGEGDNRELDKISNTLKKIDESIREAYKDKTNLSDEEIKDLMDKESWFNAKDALDKKFADEIMFNEDLTVTNSFLNELEMPTNKILNMISEKNKKEEEKQIMDLKELQEKHPDLFNEVKNLGKEEGKTEERERIKEIENLGLDEFKDLVNKAKFEEPQSPENLAMNILKAQKEKGEEAVKNFLDDKNFIVEHDKHEEGIKNSNKDELMGQMINEFANAIRGGK